MYRRISRASNLYYNNGLAKARVRDLSGAAVALRKSVDLNKLNTSARNLLGLIYYEMGETVAALSEWVISRHFQPVNNDAEEYINKVQSNLTRLEALNQAIKRYNTALGLAKQGSDDLAIIQLKKVVSLNTNFIRAYQLLALLLMKIGDNEKAKRYLLRANRIDVSNTTTLRYLQELEALSAPAKDLDSNPEAAEQTITHSIMPVSSYREDKPNIMAFVNLVIGVIIGIAVTAFLVIPTIKKNQVTDENTNYSDYSSSISQLEEKDEKIASLENDKAELQQKIEQLQDQIDNAVVPEDNSEVYASLFDVVGLYLTELDKNESDRDFLTIADMLAAVDDTRLEVEPAVTLLSRLREATYSDAARSHYSTGHALYGDGKYEEALVELAKAMVFDPADVDAVYFTARAYHRLDDKENAAKYYNIVITQFSDPDRTSKAEEFIRQVQD
jgi:tetratricopeptide (TPR) repeat protein